MQLLTAQNSRFHATASLAISLGSRPVMRHTPPGLQPQAAKLARREICFVMRHAWRPNRIAGCKSAPSDGNPPLHFRIMGEC